MTSVFHRTPGIDLPRAARGDGVYLFDDQGKRYLDGSGGAAVSCLGHGHRRVIDAIKEQLDSLAYAHTAFFTSQPAEELAALLVGKAPPSFGKAYFLSGGSEAVETALKLARAYHLAKGEPERSVFISRRQSYHGNTLGALAVSGNPGRRKPYEPLLKEHHRIAPCYAYRERRPDESIEAYALRAANELEAAIVDIGPKRVAAFIAETVVGATLGACPAETGYLKRVREICDAYGVLYIADEIMCGMGRTGRTFAFDHDGAAPDLVTVAKGLAGGYQAMGAVLVSSPVYDALATGGFEHGHTYVGHPTGCAAALAVQRVIDEDGLLANVAAQGARLRAALAERLEAFGVAGDIRGRGLMIGVEFVADRDSKKPFDPSQKFAARLKKAAMKRGLVCYPGSGCVDGVRGDHVLIAPPYIINDAETDELTELLAAAVGDALGSKA
ncbi:MAG: aspartate aminotransferase family protein [Pseudomonadota bacterium]|nr:aspartate aminotransferase family protein [Pseudomonadota bacterium]